MKKGITCVFLLILLGFTSTSVAQVRFGVKGGLNISSLTSYDKVFRNKDLSEIIDIKIDNNKKLGFNMGIFAQIEVPYTDFFIQPEVLFTNIGSKVEEKYNTVIDGISLSHKDKHTMNLNYLQMPIYAGYKLNMGAANFIFGAGPYFSYALWGSDDIFDNKEFGRFDAGLSAMVGIELDSYQISFGYDLGLVNIGKDKVWNNKKSSSLCNRDIKISFGYFF